MTAGRIGFLDFARLVIDALEATKVDYLIGGSVALWAWGEPRTTIDFDLVVNLPFEQVYALSKELERRDMLVPPDVMTDLLLQEEGDLPINAIHLKSNFKAEFFLLRADDHFRATAFARRRLVDLGHPLGEVYVHAPEDLILNKVHYYSLSYQTKHVRDICSMITLLPSEIDMEYISTWAARLGISQTWQDIQEKIARKTSRDG